MIYKGFYCERSYYKGGEAGFHEAFLPPRSSMYVLAQLISTPTIGVHILEGYTF